MKLQGSAEPSEHNECSPHKSGVHPYGGSAVVDDFNAVVESDSFDDHGEVLESAEPGPRFLRAPSHLEVHREHGLSGDATFNSRASVVDCGKCGEPGVVWNQPRSCERRRRTRPRRRRAEMLGISRPSPQRNRRRTVSRPALARRAPTRDRRREALQALVRRRSRRGQKAEGRSSFQSDARASGCRRTSCSSGVGDPARMLAEISYGIGLARRVRRFVLRPW